MTNVVVRCLNDLQPLLDWYAIISCILTACCLARCDRRRSQVGWNAGICMRLPHCIFRTTKTNIVKRACRLLVVAEQGAKLIAHGVVAIDRSAGFLIRPGEFEIIR